MCKLKEFTGHLMCGILEGGCARLEKGDTVVELRDLEVERRKNKRRG